MRNSFSASCGQAVFSNLQESRAPSHTAITGKEKGHHFEHPLFPSPSPSFMCWEICHTAWNTPAVPAMSHHNCLCIHSFLITGLGWGAEKVQVLLRNNQSIPVLPALLPKQNQTEPHAIYCEEINSVKTSTQIYLVTWAHCLWLGWNNIPLLLQLITSFSKFTCLIAHSLWSFLMCL